MSDWILITGGCRSGKSDFAVALARQMALPTLFLATCRPGDDAEMQARIAAHRAQRPAEWEVREEGWRPEAAMREARAGLVVVDCMPAWLGNLLVRDDTDAEIAAAGERWLEALRAAAPRLALVVSAEVGGGLVPETKLGRRFRDHLGTWNQKLAAGAARSYLLVAGRPIELPAGGADVAAIAAQLGEMGGEAGT